ncbi:hypothetical protein Q7P35_002309 [Cladosporium inversicolor]
MNINNGDGENIILHENGEGDGSAGVQFWRSGSKGKDPDPTFTPDCEFEIEDKDENQGYTRVTRRKTRTSRASAATGSPSALKTKKTVQRTISRFMETESEKKAAAEAIQNESNEIQKTISAKFDKLQEVNIKQSRTIDALYALSKENAARHDERAISIDAGRAKIDTTDYQAIKEKLQQGIDKAAVTKGLKIQFLRLGPGLPIKAIFENKT